MFIHFLVSTSCFNMLNAQLLEICVGMGNVPFHKVMMVMNVLALTNILCTDRLCAIV